MKQSLRIVVAEDEPNMREYWQTTLPVLGHRVEGLAQSGSEPLELCRGRRPDLVITDIKMPELDGIDAAREVFRERPVPIIVVSAYHDPDLIERAGASHILGYLVKPIKEADLLPAIELAIRRFEEFAALKKETADLRQALEDRKIIERAKGVMMRRAKLGEEEAFRRLQKLASEKRRKLIDIAQSILIAEESFEMPGSS